MPFDPVIGGVVWAGVFLAFCAIALRNARKNQPAVAPPHRADDAEAAAARLSGLAA